MVIHIWYKVESLRGIFRPTPPILRKLASVKGAVNTTSFTNDPFIADLPYPFQISGATFVKTHTSLLALVNGTGRVYALDTAGGSHRWTRLDSTFFAGYNIGCYNFYADSTVWSFGGYGLWNNNGHLRYYSTDNFEWTVKPLNREVPHIFNIFDMYWLDTTNAHLYMLGINFVNDGIRDNSIQEREIGHKTWRLDIRSGNWEALGETRDTSLHIVAQSPWGMLGAVGASATIVDFEHNRYLHATTAGQKKFSRFQRSTQAKIVAYFIDSTLYFGNYDEFMDSVGFTRADFADSGVAVYKPFKTGSSRAFWFFAILPVVAGGILWYSRQKKPPVNLVQEREPETIADDPLPAETDPGSLLDERDRSLLRTLLDCSLQGKTCSIDTINGLLGVTNKSLEIQKRQRSDSLNAINKKLSLLLGTDTEAIVRTRSTFDRRSFEYAVNTELLSSLKDLIGTKF